MKLTSDQKRLIKSIARDIGAVFIVAFGSKIRGEGKGDSDLDIAVLVHGKPDYQLFGAAYSRLSDVFRGENVDVRFLNDADPLFTMQVVRDGVLLYGDPDSYDELKVRTNRRYIDDGAVYFPLLDDLLKTQQQILGANTL